ncbi:hypothetical protein AALP_AA6G173700 [Arabis alpina]|uniref:Uncharacterized protein n=1 Tax=Arabis alpina TaxID=50452 RepID=A0A087GPU8_ARAAL|nr:hypothetical protein AALP_AA6G173700 [Arabis alpina]
MKNHHNHRLRSGGREHCIYKLNLVKPSGPPRSFHGSSTTKAPIFGNQPYRKLLSLDPNLGRS